MNWDAVSAVAEAIGAVAVVGSLIYVATQIRLANRISIREARSELIASVGGIYRLVLENPLMAQLQIKLESSNLPLTPEENCRAKALAVLWVTFMSQVNGTRESGLLPEKVYEVYIELILQHLQNHPGLIPHVITGLKEASVNPGDFAAHDRLFNFLAAQGEG